VTVLSAEMADRSAVIENQLPTGALKRCEFAMVAFNIGAGPSIAASSLD